ncbi:MAG: hypothetical protein Q7U28_10645 [Aquabacterium sp.]|nr:hypothetical protein [Aquabacterium sp.]
MPKLAEFQARMKGPDADDALKAATDLANYYIIYNEEYNTLIEKQQQAEIALYNVTHNPTGVDQAEALRLQGLILWSGSRMKFLDEKMLAFHASTVSIKPPSKTLVEQVKQLTAQIATLIAKDQAIKGIIGALTELSGLVNKTHGA